MYLQEHTTHIRQKDLESASAQATQDDPEALARTPDYTAWHFSDKSRSFDKALKTLRPSGHAKG